MKTYVIVGGVAGGASAAARLRRLDEKARIIVFERSEHVSLASCGLPYYVGGEIAKRSRLLVQTPQGFRSRFEVDVRTSSQVVAIDRANRAVDVCDMRTGRRYRQSYDKLLLSPGAAPIKPNLPGINGPRIFVLRNLPDADRIRSFVKKDGARTAVVVGGGFIGLEMAESLRQLSLDVTVVEMADQVMLALDREMAEFVHQHLRAKEVELILSDAVAGFEERADGGQVVCTAGGRRIDCDLVVLAIGVRPEVKLARDADLTIGPTGGITVNEYLQTSDEDIYAIGDAIEVTDTVTGRPALIPLAGPANRQGRDAADNMCGRKVTYRGTQGTAIVRVFDMAVANTGASEKRLKDAGIEYLKSYTHSGSHAGYYPGATPLAIKLLFAPETGRILGAQIVGVDGVDKRIDVLATAIAARMTVLDLTEIELAYAPPYGSAKDPVNMAGYVADNILRGEIKPFYPDQLPATPEEDLALLDVRTLGEVQRGCIEGAVHIHVDELRAHVAEVPCDRPLVVYCLTGVRSYYACRILQQMGYDVRNFSGGYVLYCAAQHGKMDIPGIDRFHRSPAASPAAGKPPVRQQMPAS